MAEAAGGEVMADAREKPLESMTKAELAERLLKKLTKAQLVAVVRQHEVPDGVGFRVS